MNDQKNTLLAIVLSALILIGWQIYFGLPQMEKQKQQQPAQQQQVPGQQPPAQPAPGTTPPQGPVATPGVPPVPGQPAAVPTLSREQILAQSPRVRIETPRLAGSINLKGGRIDDLSLTRYRETVDPKSPPIVLLAPSGSQHPFYAEFGWSPPGGTALKLPTQDTLWQQAGAGARNWAG